MNDPNVALTPLQEILNWSKNRPNWQRDALRRIVTGTITSDDLVELEKLALAEQGILKLDEQALSFEPLEAQHIADNSQNQVNISLASLSGLQNINRLPTKHTLPFGETPGLKIVYGDNGAGKTGYARVIKNACRARGQRTAIQPNVFDSVTAGKATAQFGVRENNGLPITIVWQEGSINDPRLGQVFVFDASCADHYVQVDGNTSFTPFGLDVLEKLSNQICVPLQKKLSERIKNVAVKIEILKQAGKFHSETTVGKQLSMLNAQTNYETLEKTLTLSVQETLRLADLRSALESDPKIQADQTRSSAVRIRDLRSDIAQVCRLINRGSIRSIKKKFSEVKQAKQFSDQIRLNNDNSLLAGTGNSIWQSLWNSAREYTAIGYPGKKFPFVDEDARCVFCQSVLDESAKNRLKRFDEYMNNQASIILRQKQRELDDHKDKFAKLPNLANKKLKVDADLGLLSDDDLSAIDLFIESCEARLKVILSNLAVGDWEGFSEIAFDAIRILRNLERKLNSRADVEAAAANPEKRLSMKTEFNELLDKSLFTTIKSNVKEVIEQHKLLEKLQKLLSDTDTRAITNMSKSLTNTYVTEEFCKRFQTELGELGLKTLQVKLQTIDGKRGMANFGVRLEGSNMVGIDKIVSEGEKGCIALALFFAELSQASHFSSLVFDDPVSSLDHAYREKVAIRLAKEAKNRQVIVFTHDPVFIQALLDAAKYNETIVNAGRLEWSGDSPGWYTPELPWGLTTIDARIDSLEKKLKRLVKTRSPQLNEDSAEQIRSIYSYLRATIERIIELKVFGGALLRFRAYINVKNLENVVGFSQRECDEVARLFKKCSDVTEAHDASSVQHAALPDDREIEQDIRDTKALVAMIETRQKQSKQTRKLPSALLS